MAKKNGGALIGGLILILGGVLALVGQFIPDAWGPSYGILILLGLGVAFLVAGLVTREDGWFIPGGILSGLGAGVALTAGPLARLAPASLNDEGAMFMLAFAGGWFLITLFTGLFTKRTHWWALIPGGIFALIGLAVGFGGRYLTALETAGRLWPIALVAAGLYVLYRAVRPRPTTPGDEAARKA